MDHSPLALLRGLGKFLAMVIISVAIGAGTGIGLSRVSGNAVSDAAAPIGGASVRTGASGTTGASRTTGDGDEPQAPRVRVLSSTFVRATATASDRRRRRARVTVRVRVTARGTKATPRTARLILGAKRLSADSNAGGGLPDSIPAGQSATGVLRFRTSGAVTTRLASRRRATLRIGDRTLRLRLTRP